MFRWKVLLWQNFLGSVRGFFFWKNRENGSSFFLSGRTAKGESRHDTGKCIKKTRKSGVDKPPNGAERNVIGFGIFGGA